VSPGEPSRGAALAGALALVMLLVVGIGLIQFLVDQPYTHAAIRLVAAVVLLVAVSRIRAAVSALVERTSAWDERPPGGRWTPSPHSHFEHFHDEIRFGVRSQRYFDHVLWPRLCALAREGSEPATPLERPPGRALGRGPSLETLRALIAAVERRR
jgi:hypothetical protein